MIGAFRLFGDSRAVDPGKVTGGMAEALITTAIGIIIALLALAFYNFFRHRPTASAAIRVVPLPQNGARRITASHGVEERRRMQSTGFWVPCGGDGVIMPVGAIDHRGN